MAVTMYYEKDADLNHLAGNRSTVHACYGICREEAEIVQNLLEICNRAVKSSGKAGMVRASGGLVLCGRSVRTVLPAE